MPVGAIAAGLIGTAIAAGGSAGASAIGNSGKKKSQARANQYNIEAWNRQNAYNDPSSQMERLRKAGLNPNMIYGTGANAAVGNADKQAPAKAADFNVENPLAQMGQYADWTVKEAQTNNLKTQNTVLVQDGILKASQAAKNAADTATTKFELNLANKYSAQAMEQSLQQSEKQIIGQDLDNQFKNGAMKDRLLDIYYQAKMTKSKSKMAELEKELFALGITKNDPWYFRIINSSWDEMAENIEKAPEVIKQSKKNNPEQPVRIRN